MQIIGSLLIRQLVDLVVCHIDEVQSTIGHFEGFTQVEHFFVDRDCTTNLVGTLERGKEGDTVMLACLHFVSNLSQCLNKSTACLYLLILHEYKYLPSPV